MKFAANKITSLAACVSTVTNLHKKMRFVRCIGWDVCVDKNKQIRVMEWNSDHNDIKFSEATQGPCFSDLGWKGFYIEVIVAYEVFLCELVALSLAKRFGYIDAQSFRA